MNIKGTQAKLIEDFPLYAILETGHIYSFKTNKYLSKTLRNGYEKLTLFNKDKCKTFVVHRLVANAFIPNPENKLEVNHKDGNKLNNHISNLEWNTRMENYQHAVENNLAFRNPKTVYQYDLKGNFIKKWDCLVDIERELGFSIGHISNICNKKYNKKYYKDFIWTYKKGDVQPFNKKCIICGKELKYSPKARNQKYCSVQCSNKNRYTPVEKHLVKCELCGKEFEAKRISQKYCSGYCYRKTNREKKKIRETFIKNRVL